MDVLKKGVRNGSETPSLVTCLSGSCALSAPAVAVVTNRVIPTPRSLRPLVKVKAANRPDFALPVRLLRASSPLMGSSMPVRALHGQRPLSPPPARPRRTRQSDSQPRFYRSGSETAYLFAATCLIESFPRLDLSSVTAESLDWKQTYFGGYFLLLLSQDLPSSTFFHLSYE